MISSLVNEVLFHISEGSGASQETIIGFRFNFRGRVTTTQKNLWGCGMLYTAAVFLFPSSVCGTRKLITRVAVWFKPIVGLLLPWKLVMRQLELTYEYRVFCPKYSVSLDMTATPANFPPLWWSDGKEKMNSGLESPDFLLDPACCHLCVHSRPLHLLAQYDLSSWGKC